jgi:hypothetical protein
MGSLAAFPAPARLRREWDDKNVTLGFRKLDQDKMLEIPSIQGLRPVTAIPSPMCHALDRYRSASSARLGTMSMVELCGWGGRPGAVILAVAASRPCVGWSAASQWSSGGTSCPCCHRRGPAGVAVDRQQPSQTRPAAAPRGETGVVSPCGRRAVRCSRTAAAADGRRFDSRTPINYVGTACVLRSQWARLNHTGTQPHLPCSGAASM